MKRIFLFSLCVLFSISTHAQVSKKALTIGFGSGKQPYVMLDNQMLRSEGHEKHFGIEFGLVRQALILMDREIKAKAIPPRELKRSIKRFRNLDAVSGVTRSKKDNLYYSSSILEIAHIAVSKNNLNTNINSISNLSGFNIIARTGSYATIKDGFGKLFHPRSGTHKHKYKEYDNNIKMHSDFWKAGSEAILITSIEEFNHFRTLLAGTHDTNDEVTINEIFPTKTRLYVAFKDKKLKKEFNDALEDLKFEGQYKRVFIHYDYGEHPDYRKPNHNEIIRQIKASP